MGSTRTVSGSPPPPSTTTGKPVAPPFARRLLLACALTLASSGCYSIGYEVDEAALSDVIAVPIFRNETLRRGLEHDLTRELRREILETSPLHLTAAGPEVPVLRGTITRVGEQVLVAGAAEEVLYGSVQVEVRFGVYRGEELVLGEDSDGDGRPDAEFRLSGLAERDTRRGEDRLDASREALRDLAEMIALELQGRRDDRYEPNDSLGAAAPLPTGRQYALIQREEDWFQLKLPARRRLRVTIYHSAELRLELCSPAGQPLGGVERRDGGRLQEWIGGVEESKVFLKVSRGDDASGGGRGVAYQLALEVLPDDAAEPNQSPGAATPLEPGREARGLARDEDWFVLTQPAGRALLVRLEAEGEVLPALSVCDGEALPLPEREVTATEQPGRRLLRIEAPAAERRVWLRLGGASESPIPYRLSCE